MFINNGADTSPSDTLFWFQIIMSSMSTDMGSATGVYFSLGTGKSNLTVACTVKKCFYMLLLKAMGCMLHSCVIGL